MANRTNQHEPADPGNLHARIAELQQNLERQRHSALQLQAEAARWRQILTAVPALVALVDDEGRFAYVNRPAPEFEGAPLVGRKLTELLAEGYRQTAERALLHARRTGERATFQAADKDQRHWYHSSVGLVALDEQSLAVLVSHNIDTLKQAEVELRDAIELWHSLVGNSPDTIVLVDRELRVLFISRTTPGYAGQQVAGQDGREFVDPEDRLAVEQAVKSAVDTGKPQHVEMRDVLDRRWWSVTLVPVQNSQRRDLVLAIASDITERRQSEAALRESETRLRLVLSQVPAVVWTVDRELQLLSVDGGGVAALGISADDWRGRTLEEMFGVSDAAFSPLAAHRTVLSGEPVQFEYQLRGRDLQIHVEPLRDSHGAIAGAIGIGLDVTARKASEGELRRAHHELERRVAERTAQLDALNQSLLVDIARREAAEENLRVSEERFRVIAETVPVAVLITRRDDGEILFVNRRAGEMFGGRHEELLGRFAEEFYVNPDDRNVLLNSLTESPGPRDIELRFRRQDGREIICSGSYQLINFGAEPAILSGFVDITRRIETEQLLRSERRLLKRLLELHERDRQLIAYEIHDGIVQDMTAALMFFESTRLAELPQDDPASAGYASGIKLLRESIYEARRLINGLRPPVLEDAGVVPAIEALTEEIHEVSGIEVDFQSDVRFERLAPALEMAIYRIVQEGLNNVWHHSRSTRAAVRLVQREENIEITVQDWGVGFDPNKVSKRRYGLMGVRERARLLNGWAIIQSQPGAGTTVQVELPLVDALMPTVE